MKSFIFNDISCEDMKVVVEEIYPLIERAAISVETEKNINCVELDYDEVGLSNIESSLNLYIMDKTKLNDIKSWLCGKGILEYDGKITSCAFFGSLKPVRTSSIYLLTLPFIRSPYWLKKDDYYIDVANTINNDGNISIDPIIKLIKKNENYVEISINDVRFKYTFPDNEEYAEFDCAKAEITYNGLLRNNYLEIDFKFPCLTPGENIVSIHSGDARIQVKRKDCWL